MTPICPQCGHRITFVATITAWLEPADWSFFGTVSEPVGEVDNRHTYGQLRGDWTTRTLKRAVRCQSDHFVHFWVEIGGRKQHRLAFIAPSGGEEGEGEKEMPPTLRERRRDTSWLP